MLTKKEKEEQRTSFILSEKFGKLVYVSLFLFKENVLGILRRVELLGIVVTKLNDKSIFDHSMDDMQIIRIKQQLVLDGISSILTVIEGLLVLIHSLSENYGSVTQNMPRYSKNLVWRAINNISAKSYSLKKILAFPPIASLGLSNQETQVLSLYFDETEKAVYSSLDFLTIFYEKYNIVYNKLKHGLSLATGGFSTMEKDFEHSSLTAFDYRTEEKMPRGYLKAEVIEPSDPSWFNVESHLNFNQKLFDEIGQAIKSLEVLCTYIVDNNLNYANNCGESYLPYKKYANGTYTILFLTNPKFKEGVEIMEGINKKILLNMVVSDYVLNLRHNFKKEEMLKALHENSVTNIFFVNKKKEDIR